jgi:hypothetical protein
VRLLLFPLNEVTWKQFTSWYHSRELPYPPQPEDVIFVGAETGDLICGVCLYPTSGPFCLVEYASTNPLVGGRVKLAAVHLLVQQIQVYGALRGKNMLCFPRDKSIHRLLLKAGAIVSPATAVYFRPGADSGIDLRIEGEKS